MVQIEIANLATVMITPMATRKHPSNWLTLYLLPRKKTDKRICHTRKVCKKDHLQDQVCQIYSRPQKLKYLKVLTL